MSRWTMADLEQVGLDRLVRPMPRKRVRMPQDVKSAKPAGQKPRSKYGAVRTTVDGLTFDSAKEARRYSELKLLEKAGEIWDLQIQPRFPLMVTANVSTRYDDRTEPADVQIGEYVGDFIYRVKCTIQFVVEDVKGLKTPLYRWKKKHFEAQYGIQIRET